MSRRKQGEIQGDFKTQMLSAWIFESIEKWLFSAKFTAP